MRVALTCDLTRHGEEAGDPEASCAWLWPLLRPALHAAGCEAVLHGAHDPGTAAALAAAKSGLPEGGRWPYLYSHPEAIDRVRPACHGLLGADLVIGHELSPNQLRILHAAGRPLLDLSLDAARFGPDLFLRARTTDPALAGLIARHGMADDDLRGEAVVLRARTEGAGGPTGPALLFAGQTDRDASLIEGSALRTIHPFVERIRAMLPLGWRLLLKPHPYARQNADILALHAAVPGSLMVDDDIYALLADPAVRLVVTLSSSVAAEARLFGKEAVTLVTPDRDTSPPPMHEGRITADALRLVLQQRLGGGAGQPEPVSLRRAVGHGWGWKATPRLRSRSVRAGEVLSFGLAGRGGETCTFGWSGPERDGRWSVGPVALLLLEPVAPGLHLTLRLGAFVPPGGAGLRLEITGGAGAPLRVVFGSPRPREVTVPLPARPGPVELRFTLAGTSRPFDHGLSSDQRSLGVRLLRAEVTEAAHAPGRARRLASRYARLAASLATALPFFG